MCAHFDQNSDSWDTIQFIQQVWVIHLAVGFNEFLFWRSLAKIFVFFDKSFEFSFQYLELEVPYCGSQEAKILKELNWIANSLLIFSFIVKIVFKHK